MGKHTGRFPCLLLSVVAFSLFCFPGFWNADVCSWEKQFFVDECPVTWAQLCHAKQFMSSLFKKIQEWDDSAGLEAFQNAKLHYWAKINDCECDIPLPDPDMYSDEVDYNTVIDPAIVADLYSVPQQRTPALSSFLCMNEPLTATALVDAEVPVPASGPTAQLLSANSDVLVMGNNTLNRSGLDVRENNSSWDVNGKFVNCWNSARWDMNSASGSKRNTGDGGGNAHAKDSR